MKSELSFLNTLITEPLLEILNVLVLAVVPAVKAVPDSVTSLSLAVRPAFNLSATREVFKLDVPELKTHVRPSTINV